MILLFDLSSWFRQNYLESLAVITGILYIYYTIKENIVLWPFGIVSSALFVWVFYNSGIYAFSFLYIIYVLISIYGWYNWNKKKAHDDNNLKIHKASGKYLLISIALTSIITVLIFIILKKYTDSDMAFTDALITAGGMIATWMITQKVLEQWVFWVFLNLVSITAMLYKGLYPSAFLFFIYEVMAIVGYFKWKKSFLQQ